MTRLNILTIFFISISLITGIAMINVDSDGGCLTKNGGGKAGYTNSPGENNCTSCHPGTVNTGGGSVTISSPNLTGWIYTPGQTYTINVTVSHSGFGLFSLGFEALLPSGANAGTLVITNSVQTQIKTAFVNPNVRNNVVQKFNGGLSPDSHTFSFNWTAPVAGTGSITFYVAGMSCDIDGGVGGDFTYTASQVVNELAVPAPVANFTASNTNICQGESITFTDISTNNPTSWSWDFGDGQTSTSQNPSYTYTSPGTYTVSMTATNAGGSNTLTMTNFITINPTLTPSVSISPSNTIVCPGTTVILTAIPVNGGSPTYSWSVDGNVVGSGETYSAVFVNGQSVVCTMTSDALCANPATVSSSTFTTAVYTVTPVIITENTGVLYSDASNGNQWYEQSIGIIAGETGQTFTPTTNGNYYTIVTDANGCTSTSNIISFVLSAKNSYNNSCISFYPNPSDGIFNISFVKNLNNKNFTIEDNAGRIVYQEIFNGNGGTIKTMNLNKFTSGLYLLKINNQEYKIIIEK